MRIYTIEPERSTLHGRFSNEFPPVLTIDPGDTVRFRTLDAGWGLEANREDGAQRQTFGPRLEGRDDGHALSGPIAIQGAEPGTILVVQINDLWMGAWGYTNTGGYSTPLNDRLGLSDGERVTLRWSLDREAMLGTNQFGQTIGLRPFMGVMGNAPAEPGYHRTAPPRVTGGNIDCKELVAGSTLFLPVAVPAALFSTGDGHAVQGDGEVGQSAIECPMDRADMTFSLRDDLPLTRPWARTPDAWITFGFDQDLDEAMAQALDEMLTLIGHFHGLGRKHALAMATAVVDLRVTQVVNGARGVHAMLRHGAITPMK
ncbi:acetamidase/formamidase family protein [soil metagenome]